MTKGIPTTVTKFNYLEKNEIWQEIFIKDGDKLIRYIGFIIKTFLTKRLFCLSVISNTAFQNQNKSRNFPIHFF